MVVTGGFLTAPSAAEVDAMVRITTTKVRVSGSATITMAIIITSHASNMVTIADRRAQRII